MPGHRPAFHFTPERGRLNDPNGLIRLEGAGHDLWHVFYQLDPGFPAEPRRTGWGYATSEDLLTWRHRPQALFPDDAYDADGCFSGGAVAPQRPGDPVELFYTGNLPVPAEFAGHGSGSDPAAVPGAGTGAARLAEAFPDGVPVGHVWGATQNLALAEKLSDGSLAVPVKHPANPLIPGPPPGFTAHYRDPIVTEDPDRPGLWRMLLGARTDDDRGTALLHFSRDRRTWDAGRELVIDGPSPGGYMWECPNLLRMTDAATGAAADVLILSPQGIRADAGDVLRNRYQCGYLVGHLELPDAPDAAAVFHVTTPFTELDHGFEFYAPQVFTDATAADATSQRRPVMLGWMGMPEEDDHPTITAEGWLHCLTFARELSLYDGRLLQSPVLPSGDDLPIVGDSHVGDVFRVRLDGNGIVELRGTTALGSSTTGSTAGEDAAADGADSADSADSTGPEDAPLVTVSLSGDRVTVTRRTAGVPNHFGDERATTLRPRGPSTPGGGTGSGAAHHLDVIVDRSAIEIIADDGAALFSLRAFSADGAWTVRL